MPGAQLLGGLLQVHWPEGTATPADPWPSVPAPGRWSDELQILGLVGSAVASLLAESLASERLLAGNEVGSDRSASSVWSASVGVPWSGLPRCSDLVGMR